jgi:hypothetical protein
VTACTNQTLDVSLHQELQHALSNGSEKVAFAALLQQLGKWQSVIGHRGVLGRG